MPIERKELLLTFFFILALWILIRPLTATSIIDKAPYPQEDVYLRADDSTYINRAEKTIPERIESIFGKDSEMLQIADCESSTRQFSASGEVLRGGSGNKYIGIFQIGEFWKQKAESMGMDIYTIDGNIAFAKFLYDEEIIKRGEPLWTQWECALYI